MRPRPTRCNGRLGRGGGAHAGGRGGEGDGADDLNMDVHGARAAAADDGGCLVLLLAFDRLGTRPILGTLVDDAPGHARTLYRNRAQWFGADDDHA